MIMTGIGSLLRGLSQHLQPRIGGVGEFVFFKLISGFLDHWRSTRRLIAARTNTPRASSTTAP
jgi:hypothetical protein